MSLALALAFIVVSIILCLVLADAANLQRKYLDLKVKLAAHDYGHVPRLEACEMCGSDPACPHCEGEGIRCLGRMKD